MNRPTPRLLILILLLLLLNLSCHDSPAQSRRKQNAARLAKLKATSAPAPLVIKDVQTTLGPDAPWQTLTSSGGELSLSNATLDFSPRTPRWRFTLTSEPTTQAIVRPNQNHSYIAINLWIGDKDANDKIIMRPVPPRFSRKGGADCIQEFDNGLWPDGTPRPFQIVISGTLVNYQAKVDDLFGAAPAVTPTHP